MDSSPTSSPSDIASGRQLLWRPVRACTAQGALQELESLFAIHGAPLVLKSDNGSAFIEHHFRERIRAFNSEILFSPPRKPSYNGAIEAGIGSLTSRTEQHAARHGHPGHWTWDDVEAALAEANATARPFGEYGPTPDTVWSCRTPILPQERSRFQSTVATRRQEVLDAHGRPLTTLQDAAQQRATDRRILRQVLVELGYLYLTRRRLPLPIPKPKTATIM
jgi:transposase InsO family protein